MKTFNNILTLALFASMTIACGASTQASDSAFVTLSSIPSVAPVAGQSGQVIGSAPGEMMFRPGVTDIMGSLSATDIGAASVAYGVCPKSSSKPALPHPQLRYQDPQCIMAQGTIPHMA
jgi:hypothetical protein